MIRNNKIQWTIHYKNGQTCVVEHIPFSDEGRTRLTKEQAEALLDKKTSDEPQTRLRSIPTNEQLFEMVANLRDQMDKLSKRIDLIADINSLDEE